MQLQLTRIPPSITDEIYNKAKGIVENGSVLKGFGNLFYVQNTTDQNKPFQTIISYNSNGSCKGGTCHRFISFKVCQNILAVTIEPEIPDKFISVYHSKENVHLINIVNIGKKSAGWKKTKSRQKRKDPANQTHIEVKRVVVPCDEHYDMIAKPTLPEPAPNQYILSMLKICHRNVSKCYVCGGVFMKKVTYKNLMIWLSSQSFVGGSLIPRRRSQQRHQSFKKFTFISMETVSGDIAAVLFHNLSKLQKT